MIDYIPNNYGPITPYTNQLTACAAGMFDTFHQNLSSIINSFPRSYPFVIRLGHELNDPGILKVIHF